MSQRKEKHLRRALNQYDGVVRDVDRLKNQVDMLERNITNTRKIMVERDRANRHAVLAVQRNRKYDGAVATWALFASVCALLIAIVLGMVLTIPVEARADSKKMITADVLTEKDMKAIMLVTDGNGNAVPSAEDFSYISQEVPLPVQTQEQLHAAAEEFGIPYALALALVDVETGFRNIDGDGGKSIGYLQVNRVYHTDLMETLGVESLWEPKGNFRVGLSYLAQHVRVCETLPMALMCYNMGPSGASAAWERGVTESEYSRKVIERASFWEDVLQRS